MIILIVILTVILAIDSLALIAVVLLQEGKSAGLSGAISGAAETYFGKNRGRTMEGKLERITKILAAVLIVLSFVIYLLAAA